MCTINFFLLIYSSPSSARLTLFFISKAQKNHFYAEICFSAYFYSISMNSAHIIRFCFFSDSLALCVSLWEKISDEGKKVIFNMLPRILIKNHLKQFASNMNIKCDSHSIVLALVNSLDFFFLGYFHFFTSISSTHKHERKEGRNDNVDSPSFIHYTIWRTREKQKGQKMSVFFILLFVRVDLTCFWLLKKGQIFLI